MKKVHTAGVRAVVFIGCVSMVFAGVVGIGSSQAITTWSGVYTVEQARRGEALYQRYCDSCHGADMTGGEQAPGLAGPEFMSNWNGTRLDQLFLRVFRDMPQNSPGVLSSANAVDVIAEMLRQNGYPPGRDELSQQQSVLATITVAVERPGGQQ
jgi:S-disulfanyl-L-cysteine oxidoreductase SoxD